MIARRIKWSGISDTRLFDPIETRLLEIINGKLKRDDTQYVSWLVQLLAFSGQTKYLPTLQGIQDGSIGKGLPPKLLRHTESSIAVLPDFNRWNPIIYANLDQVTEGSLERQRVINMLNSTEDSLVRVGASFVYDFYFSDKEIVELVNRLLLEKHSQATNNDELSESVAWLCKALGETDNPEYVATLEAVKSNATVGSVKRWSDKSLRKLRKTVGQ